jgi:DNA mismatch endonuclease (patch repair protein)
VDRINPERRSANMAAIQGRDTKPELAVRRVLRTLRVGYRLHVKGLPGRPDIVMQGRRSVIFIHGCFWHRHKRCRFAYTPKSRREFWEAKFAGNVSRDIRNLKQLRKSGWKVLVIWECVTTDVKLIERAIKSFLGWTPDARTSRPNPTKGNSEAEVGKARVRRATSRS